MGSLRFFKELPKEQINSIQLTQKRLLLLRCLILILPILFLAGLVFQIPKQKKYEAWVLLSPELSNDNRITAQIANYNQDSFQIFLSDKLLISFDVGAKNDYSKIAQTDYAALLARINHLPNKPDSLVIYTSAKTLHFSKVPHTNIPANWVQIPVEEREITTYTAAWNAGNDSIKLLQTVSNSNYSVNNWYKESLTKNNITNQKWQKNGDSLMLPAGNSLPIQNTNLSVLLLAEDTTSKGVTIMKAAFRALNKYWNTRIEVKVSRFVNELPIDADYYFLIDMEHKVDMVFNGKTCLVKTGNLSIQKSFLMREKGVLPQIYLDTEAERQDAKLVSHLANLLFPIHKYLADFDHRILDEKQLKKFSKPKNSDTMQPVNWKKQSDLVSNLGYYLLGICTFLIAWERWLSSTK